eukprot:5783396-Karenia_brevis.AAC.1
MEGVLEHLQLQTQALAAAQTPSQPPPAAAPPLFVITVFSSFRIVAVWPVTQGHIITDIDRSISTVAVYTIIGHTYLPITNIITDGASDTYRPAGHHT